jgi:hypothetical protein
VLDHGPAGRALGDVGQDVLSALECGDEGGVCACWARRLQIENEKWAGGAGGACAGMGDCRIGAGAAGADEGDVVWAGWVEDDDVTHLGFF